MSTDLANFYNRTRTARKIIVVDLGFLGDLLRVGASCHRQAQSEQNEPKLVSS